MSSVKRKQQEAKAAPEDAKAEVVTGQAAGAAEPAPPVVVFPGDKVVLDGARCKAGLGVVQVGQSGLGAGITGVLRRGGIKSGSGGSAAGSASTLWIDSATKRYFPQVDDMVVGTIIEKHSENYRVDIGLHQAAVLPALAFEGATKRNKPNLEVGMLVYCRVAVANKHVEVELTCTSPHFKKDWVTKDSMFGELTGGHLFTCSSQLARSLLDETCFVLNALGRHIPFELAIGANGRVWVNSGSAMHTVIISNVILRSETLTEAGVARYIDSIVGSLA